MSSKLLKGWKVVKLGDVVKVEGGYAFKSGEFITNGIPIVRINNLDKKGVNLDYKISYPSNFKQIEKYKIEFGDILIGMSGSIGKVSIYKNKCIALLNQRVGNVKPINQDELSKTYLYYFLKSEIFMREISKSSNGCIIANISSKDICNVEFNIPSIAEQEKIVSILERAENAIQKREEQIEALDELVKSMFIEMFGDPVINTKNWNIRKLGELGYFKNGMNYKQSDSGFNIKFLGVGEFKYGNIINNSDKLSTLELQEKPNDEYLLKDGDIVFVRSNGSKELVGRSVLIRRLQEDTTYSGFCIRYRNQSNEVTPEFLINLFSDEGFKSYFKKDSRGANINNLNQQMLSNLNIILPPIELQNQFADFVKQVDKLKFEMESSLKQLEDNFNSLMQRAFKGELF